MRTSYAATFGMVAAISIMATSALRLHAQDAPIVMKLATATLNDGQNGA